jgi:peroxin-6
MFESTDKQKQEPGAEGASPQTIGDAIEALKLGHDLDGNIGGPVTNGDKGKGKAVNSKGKGKGSANSSVKWKNKSISIANGDSDSSLDGPLPDGANGNGNDDYIIRTDHLAQPDNSD